jgi:hypothetical protein
MPLYTVKPPKKASRPDRAAPALLELRNVSLSVRKHKYYLQCRAVMPAGGLPVG